MSRSAFDRLLFIGGAPRTGTSMLVRSLDWHPEVVMFPREPAYLATVFFEDTPPEPARGGKEFVFADRARLDGLIHQFAALGDHEICEHYRTFDTDAFTQAFEGSYRATEGNAPIYAFARGLFAASLAGSSRAAARYGGRRNLVFALKVPFFVEAMFQCLSALPVDVRMVYLDREPVARYASAKARRLKARSDGRVGLAGPLDYATCQAHLHAVSVMNARDAVQRHPRSALRLRYEDLRQGPEALARLCDALDVRWNDVLLRQTLEGMSQHLPSAHGFINRGGAHDDPLREQAMVGLMTENESAYLRLLHALATRDLVAQGIASPALVEELRRLGAKPFIGESAEDVDVRARSFDQVVAWLETPAMLRDSLCNLMRSGRVGLM